MRRLSASQIKLADQIYPKVENGALLRGEAVEDARLSVYWDSVDKSSFQLVLSLIIDCFYFAHLPWSHSIFSFLITLYECQTLQDYRHLKRI